MKPNFVDIPCDPVTRRGDHFLFVGRLSLEKGVDTLIRAQSQHRSRVRFAGDGPLSDRIGEAAADEPSIQLLGRLSGEQIRAEMRNARALIFPSEWYEGFPVTLAEAYANGLPVIASRLGAMVELVEDGVTGLLFTPSDADDLAQKVRWATGHSAEMRRMGENARREYEAKYTPERNYELLMDIYRHAIDRLRWGRA